VIGPAGLLELINKYENQIDLDHFYMFLHTDCLRLASDPGDPGSRFDRDPCREPAQPSLNLLRGTGIQV